MMPLEGLRVIDASSILAGPLCCQLLADFGADVIKVEHPDQGDAMRGHGPAKDGIPLWWKEISRNKRTLGLNLSTEPGAKVFLKLAGTADVLVENFRPGTLERWGLGPEVLMDRNPRLVIVRITGFGQAGPYAQRPGFGTISEAMSGFAFQTGAPDGPPTLPSFGLADTVSGISAAAAALTALLARERHESPGQVIDINLLEPMMLASGPAATMYEQLGIIQNRQGNRSSNNAPRNTYRTKEGSWVALSTSAQNIAERVMELVGHPEVLNEPWFSSGRGRAKHADLLDSWVADWIGDRDRKEVLDAFEKVGGAIAPIYSARDLVEDPHVREREMLTQVQDPDLGHLLMHNVLWRMSETPGRIRHTGRHLGADTESILIGELGYTAEELADLRSAGVAQ